MFRLSGLGLILGHESLSKTPKWKCKLPSLFKLLAQIWQRCIITQFILDSYKWSSYKNTLPIFATMVCITDLTHQLPCTWYEWEYIIVGQPQRSLARCLPPSLLSWHCFSQSMNWHATQTSLRPCGIDYDIIHERKVMLFGLCISFMILVNIITPAEKGKRHIPDDLTLLSPLHPDLPSLSLSSQQRNYM